MARRKYQWKWRLRINVFDGETFYSPECIPNKWYKWWMFSSYAYLTEEDYCKDIKKYGDEIRHIARSIDGTRGPRLWFYSEADAYRAVLMVEQSNAVRETFKYLTLPDN